MRHQGWVRQSVDVEHEGYMQSHRKKYCGAGNLTIRGVLSHKSRRGKVATI